MKKSLIIFGTTLILSFNTYASYFLDLAIRPGVNMASTLDNYQVKNNTLNLTLGAELGVNLGYITAGGGIHYNDSITFQDTTIPLDGSFKNMPVYGFVKFNIFPVVFKPYVVGKVGLNYVSQESGFGGISKIENGTYWAMGIGFDVYNFLAELIYQNSTMTIGAHEENLSQLQLTVGVKLF